jgi:phosphoglycolate phosphatase
MSLSETLVHLAGEEHRGRGREFHKLFVEKADEVMSDLTVVLVQVPEVMQRLRGGGLSLGIVSTKFRYRIEAILSWEGLLGLFDVIVGGEDVSRAQTRP